MSIMDIQLPLLFPGPPDRRVRWKPKITSLAAARRDHLKNSVSGAQGRTIVTAGTDGGAIYMWGSDVGDDPPVSDESRVAWQSSTVMLRYHSRPIVAMAFAESEWAEEVCVCELGTVQEVDHRHSSIARSLTCSMANGLLP